MLPAFADLDTFGDRIPGGVPSGEEMRASAALDDASAKVRAVAGKNYVDSDGVLVDDIPDVIAAVTISVAKRGFINPNGYKSENEEVDDYRHAWAVDSSSSVGAELNDAEIAQIRSAAGRRSGGSARLGRPTRLPAAALATARRGAGIYDEPGDFR